MKTIHLSALFLLLFATPAHADQLTVSAAASLTDAFSNIAPAFEAAHPGVEVVLNFASSGALYRQIEQGAPVDVYASANPQWMDRAQAKGLLEPGSRRTFARNALVLAVPRDNPARIEAMDDLTADRITTVAVGTPETVPAGNYARTALIAAGLWDTLQPRFIFAESVRQVLDYLRRGEVDAGFVYATDAVQAADRVLVVADIPLETPVAYPLAVLREAADASLARAFVAFVTGPQGRAILAQQGFVTTW